jgi:outer membrane protein assembly factor BamB
MKFDRFVLMAGLAALANLSLAQDSPMYRGNAGHSGNSGNLEFPVAQKWQWVGDTGTKSVSSPAVVNGIAYFGLGGRVVALRTTTGATLWEYPQGQKIPANFRLAPAVADGLVYAPASDGSVYAINADNGKLVWQYSARSSITTPPTVANGVVYFGTADGRFYAVEAKTGNPLWAEPANLISSLVGPVVASDSLVLALTSDGTVWGISAATGKSKWSQRLNSVPSDSSIALGSDQFYVNSLEGLAAINPANGHIRWQKVLKSSPNHSPATDGKRIFVLDDAGRLYCYDSQGKPVWKDPVETGQPIETSPLLSGETVILATRKGTVLALDAGNGAIKWQYILKPPANIRVKSGNESRPPAYSPIAADPVVAGDNLLILSDYGQMFAFSHRDTVDTTPPNVYFVLPEAGSQLSGRPPLAFQAWLEDQGSGIVPSSVEMLVDGKPFGTGDDKPAFDLVRSMIEYKMSSSGAVHPLSDGLHTLAVKARDYMGNEVVKEWMIQIDNSLTPGVPKPRNQESGGSPGGYGGSGGGG